MNLYESNISLGLHSARYLNFRKAATCSHSQPLEWPQVAASGRSVEWPQVTASGRLRRVAEVFQSHKKQPLAATRSHSSGRKWPLFPSGRKWPRVAALSSGRKWPQVAAFDAWPRCFNLIKSSHLQPLAATRVAASGRFSRVAASGREWPPLPSITSWIRNWGKHPLAAAGSLPIHLNLKKKHLSNKTYFFKMFEDYR